MGAWVLISASWYYTATSRPPRRIAGLAMPPLAAWLGTLIGIAILAAAWARVGRDPKGGAIYPRFEPPAGLSPAAARFIRQQGFDDGCLTAAILSMAVKGALTIRETGKGLLGRATYALQPQGRTGRRLSRGEVAAYLALFAEDDAPLDLKPDKKNGARVDRARAALQKALRDEHVDATFRRNARERVAATGAGAVLTAGMILYGANGSWVPVALWAGAALAVAVVVNALAGLIDRPKRIFGAVVVIALLGWFCRELIGTVASDAQLGGLLSSMAMRSTALAGGAFGIAAALFGRIMGAPTRSGRRLLDELEGFGLYMKPAEEDRLDKLHPPERTPELFERLLPYAVALGLAQQWAAKFASVLAGADAPSWYRGSDRFDTAGFGANLGSAVGAAKPPAQRSSSGFSGGGGGGGGW
jgi:hypothetical protein